MQAVPTRIDPAARGREIAPGMGPGTHPALTTFPLRVALALLVLLTTALGASAVEADEAERDREAEALRVLAEVFPKGSAPDQIAAIRAAQEANSATVSKAIAKDALRSKELGVQIAGMKALGQMQNPASVKALHRLYKAHQSKQKDEKFFITLLTEVGRLGDPSSVSLLIDSPFKHSTLNTGRARIYGLGNIRTNEAVAALIKGIMLQGPQSRGMFGSNNDVLLPDFQTALTVLSGADQGAQRQLWTKWWRNNAKTFEIESELPVIPPALETHWEGFWGVPYPVEVPVHGYARFDWVLEPTKEQVKYAVEALEDARKSKSSSRQLAAIYANMLIVDPKVVKSIHKVSKKSGRSVIEAAIDALGWIPHKSALKELQGIYRRHRDLYKFENYYARMLKAIGRHSDPSSLDILLDKPLKGLTMASGRARILGTARIRSKAAVERLMKAMNLAGGDGRRPFQVGRGTQPFMGAIRMALVILTGEDQGESKIGWQKWWRENRRTFKVSEELPELSESMRESWETYWEAPYGS